MKQKIYKFQLISLFTIAFLNLIFFYFKERLPDNYFEISSQNQDINLFTYYVISAIAHVGFYTGVWVFAGFVAFALIYSFVLNQKKVKGEAFLAVLPVTAALFLCYVIFPETVGDGLGIFIREMGSTLTLLLILISHALILYYLIAPQSFKSNAKLLYKTAIRLAKSIRTVDTIDWSNLSQNLKRSTLEQIQKIKNSFLKKSIPAIPVQHPAQQPRVQRSQPEPVIATPIHQTEELDEIDSDEDSDDDQDTIDEDIAFDASEDVTDEDETDDSDETDESSEDEFESEPSPYIKATTPFFEQEELINCVAPQHRIKPQDPDSGYFTQIGHIVEDKLKEFGINSEIVGVMKGPVVDTFELNLGAGVKVSSVSNRADDVSLALSGAPIRMVYPMKGKTTFGVEVPRNPREFIYLDEVLKTPEFRDSTYKLPIAMGKDAYGRPSVVDLTAMPHMLVAGTTGSGKSVFVNTLLVSLIVKNAPENLKLILIDPKFVELAIFQKIPHLIMPPITDASMASVALLWAVEEMERRYKLLREISVRNIEGYNNKIAEADSALLARVKQHFEDDSEDFTLPFLVIVVDEVADLMQSKNNKEIEANIARLAAKARAAGIHLVLATQRPSTDVITGVIKSNFPTRIAFKVISNMDSRVILDVQGAEKLLGKGDMLFKQGVDLLRVHSSFVDEGEIEKLVEVLSEIPAQYSQAAMDFIETAKMGDASGEPLEDDEDMPNDALFEEAVKLVASTRQASASWIQRRMNVGYNRAAKLVEAMERRGIVGPANGSKPRQVLVAPPDDLTT